MRRAADPAARDRAERSERQPERPRKAGSLDVSLWLRLLDSHNLMLLALRRELGTGTSATLARFDLLSILDADDGLTLAELSRRLRVTAGNLTGLVDRAARDGLVERRSDPGDRRLSRVFLTKHGRAFIHDLLPTHARQVSALVSGLDAAERRQLRVLLGKLRDSLVARSDPRSRDGLDS